MNDFLYGLCWGLFGWGCGASSILLVWWVVEQITG